MSRTPRRLSAPGCRAIGWSIALVLGAACHPPRATEEFSAAPSTAHDPEIRAQVEALFGPVRVEELQALSAAADAAPQNVGARRDSGMAHMWAALGGALELSTRAELDLEAAFALDPTDTGLTRALGRFYNLRGVAGDRSKAAMQVEVYAAHLGDTPVEAMDDVQFVAWSFSRLGAILELRNHGRLLAALGEVEALEDVLARRVAATPANVELHALAGNFAFFFAGNIPVGRRQRVERAVAHFEVVRQQWEAMRRGARDGEHCPNTRENFMFELAEGYLVLGRLDQARALHGELTAVRPPITRAKQQIAEISAERVQNAGRYDGEMRLMPPWPSDVGNCVVCHAWNRDVPLDSLYTAAR